MTTQESGQPRRRNQRGEGGRLRDEIIDAAMRILDRSPATVLTLRMVAREAGIAPPSVYSQFADAGEMQTEIIRECWNQLGASMAQCASTTAGDALVQLKAQLAAYVRYAMERPSRYQLLFAPTETERFPDLPGLLQPAYRNVLHCIERLAAEGVALPAKEVQDAAVLIISIVHGRIGIAHLAPQRPRNSPSGVEVFVSAAIESIFSRRPST